MSALPALHVVGSCEDAARLLSPVRLRLLERLREPNSAAGVARELGMPRQKVNYHLRQLENAGLVQAVEERRKGNVVERIVRASASHYLVSPSVLGNLRADPAGVRDRFSSTYLVALAAKTIHEVSALREGADAAGKKLATFTLQFDVRFASPQSRTEFAQDLANSVAKLVAKHHDDTAEGGRTFSFHMGGYPRPVAKDDPSE